MFGHDNQDNNQDNTTGGHLTIPEPVEDQSGVQPSTAPVPGKADEAGSLGGFLPSSNEPGFVPAAVPVADDLLDIKQEALQALSPLVGHLEQSPEEKFRTTMMMIQASDDHSLIRVAYEAAKQIENEKERAQALLDIVNEINYFTQHQQVTA